MNKPSLVDLNFLKFQTYVTLLTLFFVHVHCTVHIHKYAQQLAALNVQRCTAVSVHCSVTAVSVHCSVTAVSVHCSVVAVHCTATTVH